ncbi:MAG: hypothetical protein AUG51_03165 [Acidobacteria bacterium 13_1_20CM_3_53_8]|nr:MAG: hypothetical protein AUG51_03165 [Acidobacteria bacterium 13_1_20CM_3_53_8]
MAVAIFNSHHVTQADDREQNNLVVDEQTALIESALYTRVEFFGAQALVPYPTAEARNRLVELKTKYPDEPQLYLKLSQLDEKLGRENEASGEIRIYVELEPDKMKALETLAAFSHRRAQFEGEAEALERMLEIAPPEKRVEIFRRLIELARPHLLQKYLAPAFYQKTLAQNPSAFEIIEQYIQKLSDERNYQEALKVLREYKEHFPQKQVYLIETETSILDAMGEEREAEAVFTKAFDPFWPDELSENFYQFLRDHDRYRAYGHELREAFRRNPADYDVAVRLHHYSKHAYDESPDIFVQLERTRAARNIAWKADELTTVARLLLAEGYADAASRFLYTLYLQGEMRQGSTARAKVLYQLFEILSDSSETRISLTHGDLNFYRDVASADTHPGMLGGILSLVLSDTDPRAELQSEETRAVEHFNRAAAYRIFVAYKQEYPTSPELAQMYLDIVRLYTATHETGIAEATLAEFESRYSDAPAYPEVALKLADCYIAAGKQDEERALYHRVLDYLGQHRQPGVPLVPNSQKPQTGSDGSSQSAVLGIDSDPTEVKPSPISYPPSSNPGIQIPEDESAQTNNSYSSNSHSSSSYTDYLAAPDARVPSRSVERRSSQNNQTNRVDYATVLARLVASLARDNRTSAILVLYSDEIKKYGDEEGLYEQMLEWLGQTNMVEEQLRVYQETIKKFPSVTWRDRMARWYLRRQRKQEFEAYSRELLSKLNDEETARYLRKFVDANASASASSFEANLYLGLYSLAHERFPHNLEFVNGLLKFYSAHTDWAAWRKLVAEYYFESRDIRDQFLSHLASRNELRSHFNRAREVCSSNAADDTAQNLLPYKLFRADAAAWLSNYEEAIDAYRELNRLYPNTPEFSERLINFTRSLGQHNRRFLEEAGATAKSLADAYPSSADYRTRAGEVQAELGDYSRARGEWEQLIALGLGEPETYLDVATVYWDYFQYTDALNTIKRLRRQTNDQTLYAFQAGAILEAEHKLPEALGEYMKALNEDEEDDERAADQRRAGRRLVTLSQRQGIFEKIALAFNQERQRRGAQPGLLLGYADFLRDAKRWPIASRLLRDEIKQSDSQHFLERARDLFAENEEVDGEVAALKRQVALARSPRFDISFRLQLAEVYRSAGEREEAARELRELVEKFPTNYGVLNEAASFYWRIGSREETLEVLREGMQRGLGKFHYLFARQLAAREMEMNRVDEAERVLENLHDEDRLNTEVFRELARLYVRTGNRDALRARFLATLKAIKAQDIDIHELHQEVATLRSQMIVAFTRLGDYSSAVEQHIEIINRDPEDEENLNAAINYVKRYGGADTLLDYYRRTSQQAYKNYRWNVVLARIYEAKGDLISAAREYHAAIENQPEMLELYDALADVYTRAEEYDSALAALNKAAELSNDDPQYIKRIVALLERAGRQREADIERQKLPAEAPRRLSIEDQFNEAARLRSSERARAIATYREAFNTVLSDPFKHDLKSSDITGYVQTVSYEETLDKILRRLWELRARMISESERPNNSQAGRAREILGVLDGAIPESVGGVAADRATGDELSALHNFLQAEMESAMSDGGNRQPTLSLIQNLSRRAGFGSLEEKILIWRKNTAYFSGDAPSYHNQLRALIDFYSERGDYNHVIELLTEERARDHQSAQFEYSRMIAENAQLLGDTERELKALREIYQQPNIDSASLSTSTDTLVERYFEILSQNGEAGRSELLACAQRPTRYQLQLINFLLGKGDRELAHEAIEHTPLSLAWKSARNAETSLALNEFDARNESYFLTALKFEPIGNLVKQQPDTTKQLVGDDWFHLAQTYGQWLYASGGAERRLKSQAFLPAMIENRPQDTGEQARLGRFLLAQRDVERAIEHLELAHDAQPDDRQIISDLGSAYFSRGDFAHAKELWEQIIAGEPSFTDYKLYLDTLTEHKLAIEARKNLTPLLVKQNSFGEDEEDSTGNNKQFDEMKALIRALAASFEDQSVVAGQRAAVIDEATRADFFQKICEAVPDNLFLPAMIIKESLVARPLVAPFYQMLIKRSAGLSSYESDYDYTAQLQTSFDDAGIEEALDHESDYKTTEPDSKRIKWQREYLEYLIKRNNAAEARSLITQIETEIKGRYARPIWLRLAKLRLEIRDGHAAQSYDGLAHLVGIETSENVMAIKPPSTERLNDAVKLLRSEGREQDATALTESFYARQIALAQYEPAYFVGLSRIAFKQGDNALGLKWLAWMIKLSDAETEAETQGELASLPLIKTHQVDAPGTELPEAMNAIKQAVALRLAAETAGEFGQFNDAITYRQQLLIVSPEDEENRIELVRVLFANKKTEEAVDRLAEIIGDRAASRRLRWQAAWLSSEIVGQRSDLWSRLRERVAALDTNDSEMKVVLESLALSSAGRIEQAIELVKGIENINPNPYLKMYRALLEKRLGHEADSLKNFVEALIASRDSTAWQSFSFNEDEPLEQIIRLYLGQNSPRAALKLAERDNNLQPAQNGVANEALGAEQSVEAEANAVERNIYQTLRVRAGVRERDARAELLEMLARAAEEIGDINRAVALERARIMFLSRNSDRQAAQGRLDQLLEQQKVLGNQPKRVFVIDQQLVSKSVKGRP